MEVLTRGFPTRRWNRCARPYRPPAVHHRSCSTPTLHTVFTPTTDRATVKNKPKTAGSDCRSGSKNMAPLEGISGAPGVSAYALPEYPLVTICPSKKWVALNLRDLGVYREVLYFLAWRDIKVRYQQTLLGVAWAIIQPLFTML